MAATGPVDHILRPKVAATEDSYGGGRSLPPSAVSYTPENMPAGVARIVNGARRIFDVSWQNNIATFRNSSSTVQRCEHGQHR